MIENWRDVVKTILGPNVDFVSSLVYVYLITTELLMIFINTWSLSDRLVTDMEIKGLQERWSFYMCDIYLNGFMSDHANS